MRLADRFAVGGTPKVARPPWHYSLALARNSQLLAADPNGGLTLYPFYALCRAACHRHSPAKGIMSPARAVG